MKQRLATAASLLRDREPITLDEPANGLDPQGTREVRTLIGQRRGHRLTRRKMRGIYTPAGACQEQLPPA
jgi:ABC-type Na+ transport system ATPase subunit NatA